MNSILMPLWGFLVLFSFAVLGAITVGVIIYVLCRNRKGR